MRRKQAIHLRLVLMSALRRKRTSRRDVPLASAVTKSASAFPVAVKRTTRLGKLRHWQASAVCVWRPSWSFCTGPTGQRRTGRKDLHAQSTGEPAL